jgi:RNA polymerase sigma-70 factor (ECF subfamily)
MRLLGRDDEVEDVVQDVFLIALNGLSQVREPGALRAWLATVTVRVSRERLRLRRLKSFLRFDDTPTYEDVAAPGASPEERALLAQVYAILDALPVNERIAWTLRYIEGQPLADVAALVGCSLATAKRRIAAAHNVIDRSVADG